MRYKQLSYQPLVYIASARHVYTSIHAKNSIPSMKLRENGGGNERERERKKNTSKNISLFTYSDCYAWNIHQKRIKLNSLKQVHVRRFFSWEYSSEVNRWIGMIPKKSIYDTLHLFSTTHTICISDWFFFIVAVAVVVVIWHQQMWNIIK